MSTVLRIRRFGDPILRAEAKHVSSEEIKSPKLRKLINNIREINKDSQYGVGLAAPQVGVDVALSIIGIRPTPNRPKLEPFEQVIINPAYTGVGEKVDLWEGCMSCGTAEDVLYAQVPRYESIKAEWLDENAVRHTKTLSGFVAHVFQHETDHLNGVLFVDLVEDTSTYMMADEYRQRIVNNKE